MRIITGEFKGRRLEMPVGNDVRPTTEKVKEAIFSTIQAYIYDAKVCDLFSGTGNLGLEAISRGAKLCYFADNSRASLDLTKRNIKYCQAEDRSVVIPGDFEKCLNRLSEKKEKIDIFFLDPPYHEGLYERCFDLISTLDLLDEDGIILAEHDSSAPLPDEFFGFKKLKDKSYGSIAFSIFEK